MTLHPPLTLLHRLNVPSPRLPQFLDLEKTIDLLFKAHSVAAVRGWELGPIGTPPDGSVFFFKFSAVHDRDRGSLRDGFGWLDEEKKNVVTFKNRELEVYERKLGFKIDDKAVSIKRRRYRLNDPSYNEINMVHYLAVNEVIKPPIVPALILEMPVDMTQMAAQQQIMAATFMQQQRQHMEDAQRKKIAALRNIRPPVPDEFPGDEIDSSTTRLVSVNRYKRNFDFIDQILSPYNLADITPPSIFPDASSQKVDDLNAKLEHNRAEIEKLKAKHHAQVKDFQAHNIAIWKGIEDLKDINRDVGDVQDDVETALGIKYGPFVPRMKKRTITAIE